MLSSAENKRKMLGNGRSHLKEVIRQSTVNKVMVVTQIYIQAYFIDKVFL